MIGMMTCISWVYEKYKENRDIQALEKNSVINKICVYVLYVTNIMTNHGKLLFKMHRYENLSHFFQVITYPIINIHFEFLLDSGFWLPWFWSTVTLALSYRH